MFVEVYGLNKEDIQLLSARSQPGTHQPAIAAPLPPHHCTNTVPPQPTSHTINRPSLSTHSLHLYLP